jgi:hypothetical protein
MIICYEGRPGQGMSFQTLPQIANRNQEPKTMRLTSPTHDNPKETISKEELVAGMLASGCVTLVEAKMKARDRNLTIRIRKNARAAA